MKRIIVTVFIAITSLSVFAQSAKFHDAMVKAIAEMDSAKTADQFLGVANKFERIALAEKNQWLPYYYSALAKTTATFMTENKASVDEILDGAQKFADLADSLQPDNSEIVLLKGMILGGRIMVDPMSRGMQYGMQSSMFTSQAMTLDANNPRSYLMMGQSLFYTPEQFGGGKEKGCAMAKIANEKYASFIPASDLHPNWGKEMATEMMSQCGDLQNSKDN